MYLRVFVHESVSLSRILCPPQPKDLKNQPEAGAATDVVKMSVA